MKGAAVTLAEDLRAARTDSPSAALACSTSGPYSRALEQAELLRQGCLDLIDAANLADEMTVYTWNEIMTHPIVWPEPS